MARASPHVRRCSADARVSVPAGGGALYTNEQRPPGRAVPRARALPEPDDAEPPRTRTRFRRRIGDRGPGPGLPDRRGRARISSAGSSGAAQVRHRRRHRPHRRRRRRSAYAAPCSARAPAVVNIYTARLVTERVAPSARGAVRRLLAALPAAHRAQPGFRRHRGRRAGTSSPTIMSSRTPTPISVQLADGRMADATIVGRDPDTDLAVLKIDLKHAARRAPSAAPTSCRSGTSCSPSATRWACRRRSPTASSAPRAAQQLGVAPFEDFIQTDAAINFGNSGGALVDTQRRAGRHQHRDRRARTSASKASASRSR